MKINYILCYVAAFCNLVKNNQVLLDTCSCLRQNLSYNLEHGIATLEHDTATPLLILGKNTMMF